MTGDVDAPRLCRPRFALGTHDPGLEDLGRQLPAVVGVKHARTAQVPHGLKSVDKPRRQGDRLRLAALDGVDVLDAAFDERVSPDNHASGLQVKTRELERNDLAASETTVTGQQNRGKNARINLSRCLDDPLVGVVLIKVGLSLIVHLQEFDRARHRGNRPPFDGHIEPGLAATRLFA